MRILFAALLSLLLISSALGQDAEKQKKLDSVSLKLKQLDLMNHILPILMTKDQLKQILPTVEKSRQKVKEAQAKEYEALVRFEKRIEEAHKQAMETNKTPGRALLDEIYKMFAEMSLRRELVAEENTDAVLEAMKKALNEGQLKAAANDLNPKLYDPSLEPEEMSMDTKLRFFVKQILLDPAAYDVLLMLSKQKS